MNPTPFPATISSSRSNPNSNANRYGNVNLNQHHQTTYNAECSVVKFPEQINDFAPPQPISHSVSQSISSSNSNQNRNQTMNLQTGYLLVLPIPVMHLESTRMQQGNEVMNHMDADNVTNEQLTTGRVIYHGSHHTVHLNDQQILIPRYNQMEYTLSSDNSPIVDIRDGNVSFVSAYPSSDTMHPLPSTQSIAVRQMNPPPERLPITNFPSSQTTITPKNQKSGGLIATKPSAKELDLEKLKVEMADILKRALNQNVEVIQGAVAKLLSASTVSTVRFTIDCIIENALSMKPRLSTHCARKSAAICWMVHSFWRSVSNNEIEWKWSDQAFNQMKKLDIFEILKEQSLMKFYYELQVGDDRDKFVNLMVLMSELYNKDLLYVFTIVEVIGAILCERNLYKVGSNDIHGLYEIFKRCSRKLRRSRARKDIEHYLRVLDRVSSWKKFTKYQSVEFKIKQMQNYYYQ